MSEINSSLLTEKYRPQTLDDIILPAEIKSRFKKIVDSGDVPNMLLYSTSPGVGKTTLAKILVNDCNFDYLYINNSLERGIDVLRNRISKFAGSLSFDGSKKAVILDEFDGSSPDLQDALRASIEEFHDSCRFICTCNYVTKISGPLQSRLELHDFNFTANKNEMGRLILSRLKSILKNEDISYDDEKTLKKIVIKNFPDIRKMLVLIQKSYSQYGMITNDIFKTQMIGDELYDLILSKKFSDARKYVIDKNYNYDEIYGLIKKNILDCDKITDKGAKAAMFMILNEYDYKSKFVTDKELNFAACLMELFKYIPKKG